MPNSINDFPDDILVAILSCLPLKEAAKTSALSQKWRYLWQFTFGSLEFESIYFRGNTSEQENFIRWVNHVLNLHRGSNIDKFIIAFRYGKDPSHHIDSWIDFAIQKEVKRLELKLFPRPYGEKTYIFPDVDTLLSRLHKTQSAFLSLKAIRLQCVNIKEEVFYDLLASCPYLEELCVVESNYLYNLKIVDPPPYFKHLEICGCQFIKSMEISAKNLILVLYYGGVIDAPFKNVPNMTELALGGTYCTNFIFEPNKHLSYSVGLEKLRLIMTEMGPTPLNAPLVLPQLRSLKQLVLEINATTRKNLLFFILLIKASPLLRQMKICIGFQYDWSWDEDLVRYPEVSASDASGFVHEHLKVVEMDGFIGISRDTEFILHLVKIAPSLERIVLDLRNVFCSACWDVDEDTIVSATKKGIEELRVKLPPQVELIVIEMIRGEEDYDDVDDEVINIA